MSVSTCEYVCRQRASPTQTRWYTSESITQERGKPISTITPQRAIPAAHLAFDLEAVLELARHLSPEEQNQLIEALLRERKPQQAATAEELRARFATWDAESSAEPPSTEDDAAYDAMIARLDGDAA